MKQKKLIALLAMCSILTLSTTATVYAEEMISSTETSAPADNSGAADSSELNNSDSENAEAPTVSETPAASDNSANSTSPVTTVQSVTPGSSQADAGELTLGTKITGTAESNTHSWFTFTTGATAGTAYNITLTNHSDTDSLEWYLYDEYGTQIGDRVLSGTNGVPATIYAQELENNTSYYISISPWSSDPTDYSLIVQDPEEAVTPSEDSRNQTPAQGNATPGTSPDDAQLLASGSKINGTIESGTTAWFGFCTNADTSCNISIINTSSDTDCLELYLYDQYGSQIGDRLLAGTDGVPATFFTADMDLNPNTTYYFSMSPWGNATNYTISVKSPTA